MPVNGWLGLAFELRRNQEVEPERAERAQLRQALAAARRSGSHRVAPGEIRRATVEAQQAVLRHALEVGDLALVRRTGRSLRTGDFAGEPDAVEALLAVLRDARSAEPEILEAAARLARLVAS